jgi:hypothetical protein
VTVPLGWADKASSFWIILLLVSGQTDHGPIRVKPNVKVASGATAAALVTGADDPIGCSALERPLRIRHSAVRILSAQPATMVSSG